VPNDVIAEVSLILQGFCVALKDEIDGVRLVYTLAADSIRVIAVVEWANYIL
jgi:hypothetical protein